MSLIRPKTLTLASSDGASFEMSEAAASMFGAIRSGGRAAEKIPTIKAVDGEALGMMVAWCERRADKSASEEEVKKWESKFVKEMHLGELYRLFAGADLLDVAELVDFLAETVVSMIRGKSDEQIRRIFDIENDMPPALEAQILRKNPLAFV